MAWSLSGGTDVADFAIDSTTGALTFNAAPTHSATATDNVKEVIVRATDTAGNTTDQSINITIIEADAPQISGPGGSTAASSSVVVGEDNPLVYQFSADESVTWSIVDFTVNSESTDSDKFSIDSETGKLLFVSLPDLDSEVNLSASGLDAEGNAYSVVIQAEDNVGNISTQKIDIIAKVIKSNVVTSKK